MSGARLPAPLGVRLDRTRPIRFQFNGRSYSGYRGDTLAAALLANGEQLIGRSFKLHRPRGIFGCGIEEPAGLVDVGVGARRAPNVRSTVLEISDGLVAHSVNCWPSVGFDLGAVNGWFGALLPAGFYYKTFKWPNWHVFEPTIRRMAGLGRVADAADPDRYEEVAETADVLVIGAGIAGLSAAVTASEAGARVTLLASGSHLGGALGWRNEDQVAKLIARSQALGVHILRRTMAFGIYDHNLVCARQQLSTDALAVGADAELRERLWKIRARNVIAATGAFERPMVFPNNDRPGVMLASAAEKFAGAYGVACGRRALIAANSDSAYATAQALKSVGVEIAAIIDRRPASSVANSADSSGFKVFYESSLRVVDGSRAVSGCVIAAASSPESGGQHFDCDLILSAGGWAPAVHFHSQAGGRLRWLEEESMFVPDGAAPGLVSVGACAGVFSVDLAAEHAAAVGTAIARGGAPPPAPVCGAGRSLANTYIAKFKGKQFVDLQNDVTAADVQLAASENYRSVEHLKRYTTMGMGTDQGKTSNINALVLLGQQTGRAPAEVGTTKFRPPFAPVSLGVIAGRRVGRLYRPLKHLPAQAWHEVRGAVFEEYGGWWRPSAYPRAGESIEAAALREALATRNSAGIFDGSALGKLEIYGADAAKFLDFMYVGTMSTLAVGQARYGLLLNENGILVDDGIVARLGEHHYWVNTTSGGVDRTAAAFEEWLQCEYVDLKVLVTPVTSTWSNVTVSGPRSWSWLEAVGLDSALAPATFAHMRIATSEWHGIPLRVLRASFSGELGYEINVPVDRTAELFDALWTLAGRFDAVAYGVEALQVMRIEKGYIHIGTDTDGTTIPGDIGVGRVIERKRSDFVGRRSLGRPAARDTQRFQLVGLVPRDGSTPLPVGAQIARSPPPTSTEGHVTSSTESPLLGHPVALAMLARGSERVGESVQVHHLGSTIEATVVKVPFVDAEGLRLQGNTLNG